MCGFLLNGFRPSTPGISSMLAKCGLLLLAMGLPLWAQAPLADIRFDSAADSKGSQATSITVNGATWTAGRTGEALLFDGYDDYLRLDQSGAWDLVGDLSFAVWIKIDAYPTVWKSIANKFSNDTRGEFNFRIKGSSGGQFYYGTGSATCLMNWNPAVDLPLGTWTHFAGVRDMSANTLTLYVNGVAKYTRSLCGVAGRTYSRVVLGMQMDNVNRSFDGAIDEFRLYDRVLSGAEVQGLMHHRAEWRLDAGSGAVVADNGPFGHAGTVQGATWTPGAVDHGLRFDGVDDFVSIADAGHLDIRHGLTISAWIWPESVHKGHVVAKEDSYKLMVDSDGFAKLLLKTSDGWVNNVLASNSTVVPGRWTHVVATYDAVSGDVLFYLDGSADAVATKVGEITPNNADVVIGARDGTAAFPFHGVIDEVMLYDRALTAGEISSLFSAVDMTPPTVSVTALDAPAGLYDWYNANTTFQLSSPDAVSIEYAWNDGVWTAGTSTSLPGDGVHTLETRATDAVGNTTSETLSLTPLESLDAAAADALTALPLEAVTFENDNAVYTQTGFPGTVLSTDYLAVDPAKRYHLTGQFRSMGASGDSKLYYGLAQYDENYTMITPWMANRRGNDGVITAVSATEITVADPLSGWCADGSGWCGNWHQRSLGFYYDGDSQRLPDHVQMTTNRAYGSGLYVTAADGATVITLNEPLPQAVVDAIVPGVTVVKNHYSGGTYLYAAAAGDMVPDLWTEYTADNISGEGFSPNRQTFRFGTRYVRVILLANFPPTDTSGHTLWADDLVFSEVDQYKLDTTAPSLDSLNVSDSLWGIDGQETYAITMAASDDGSGLWHMRSLINYQGGNQANRRGYFAWKSNSYAWTDDLSTDRMPCQGGGFAEMYNGPNNDGFGYNYIDLVDCYTSGSDAQRTVTWVVRPHVDFGAFPQNDISMWARDYAKNNAAWTNVDLNFASELTPGNPYYYPVGMQLWLNFEEGSGSNAFDASPMSHTAQLVNGALWGEGRLGSGSGVDLDGVDDYVQVGDLGDPLEATMAFWFRTDQTDSGAQVLLSGGASSWWLAQDYDAGVAPCDDPAGNLCFNGIAQVPADNIQAGVWHHVAVTTHPSDGVRIYLNGVEKAHDSVGYAIDLAGIRLGADANLSNPFAGQLDDLQIYDRALTSAEVLTLLDGAGPQIQITSPESMLVLPTWEYDMGLVAESLQAKDVAFSLPADASAVRIDSTQGPVSVSLREEPVGQPGEPLPFVATVTADETAKLTAATDSDGNYPFSAQVAFEQDGQTQVFQLRGAFEKSSLPFVIVSLNDGSSATDFYNFGLITEDDLDTVSPQDIYATENHTYPIDLVIENRTNSPINITPPYIEVTSFNEPTGVKFRASEQLYNNEDIVISSLSSYQFTIFVDVDILEAPSAFLSADVEFHYLHSSVAGLQSHRLKLDGQIEIACQENCPGKHVAFEAEGGTRVRGLYSTEAVKDAAENPYRFRILNIGTEALDVSSLSIGAQSRFSLLNNPAPLQIQPGDVSPYFTVMFDATDTDLNDTYSTAVTLASNADDDPSLSFTLQVKVTTGQFRVDAEAFASPPGSLPVIAASYDVGDLLETDTTVLPVEDCGDLINGCVDPREQRRVNLALWNTGGRDTDICEFEVGSQAGPTTAPYTIRPGLRWEWDVAAPGNMSNPADCRVLQAANGNLHFDGRFLIDAAVVAPGPFEMEVRFNHRAGNANWRTHRFYITGEIGNQVPSFTVQVNGQTLGQDPINLGAFDASTLPQELPITFTNAGTSAVDLVVDELLFAAVQQPSHPDGALYDITVAMDPNTVLPQSVQPGQSHTFMANLDGGDRGFGDFNVDFSYGVEGDPLRTTNLSGTVNGTLMTLSEGTNCGNTVQDGTVNMGLHSPGNAQVHTFQVCNHAPNPLEISRIEVTNQAVNGQVVEAFKATANGEPYKTVLTFDPPLTVAANTGTGGVPKRTFYVRLLSSVAGSFNADVRVVSADAAGSSQSFQVTGQVGEETFLALAQRLGANDEVVEKILIVESSSRYSPLDPQADTPPIQVDQVVLVDNAELQAVKVQDGPPVRYRIELFREGAVNSALQVAQLEASNTVENGFCLLPPAGGGSAGDYCSSIALSGDPLNLLDATPVGELVILSFGGEDTQGNPFVDDPNADYVNRVIFQSANSNKEFSFGLRGDVTAATVDPLKLRVVYTSPATGQTSEQTVTQGQTLDIGTQPDLYGLQANPIYMWICNDEMEAGLRVTDVSLSPDEEMGFSTFSGFPTPFPDVVAAGDCRQWSLYFGGDIISGPQTYTSTVTLSGNTNFWFDITGTIRPAGVEVYHIDSVAQRNLLVDALDYELPTRLSPDVPQTFEEFEVFSAGQQMELHPDGVLVTTTSSNENLFSLVTNMGSIFGGASGPGSFTLVHQSGGTPGVRTGLISFRYREAGTNNTWQTRNLTLIGQEISEDLAVADTQGATVVYGDDVVYANLTPGQTDSETFTVTQPAGSSMGNLALAIDSNVGTGFQLVGNNTLQLAPGQSASFTVDFQPAVSGGYSGLVDLVDVNTGLSLFRFRLNGTANFPPVATNDTVTVTENTFKDIPVTLNDSDTDNDVIRLVANPIITAPNYGQAVRLSNTSIRYTPNPNFLGSDSFVYRITDDNGGFDTATVAITVAEAPLTSPTGIVASDNILQEVHVSWDAVPEATSYTVYRSTSTSTSGMTKIADSSSGSPLNVSDFTSATSFIDYTVTPGVTHYYRVRARRGTEVTPYSGYDSGFAVAPPQPDLAWQNVSLGKTVIQPGEWVSYHLEIIETNSGIMPNATITMRAYYSSDAQWDSGDEAMWLYIFAAPYEHPEILNSGGTLTQSAVDGSGYILFKLDTTNAVAETNESNNVAAIPITVDGPDVTGPTKPGPTTMAGGCDFIYNGTCFVLDADFTLTVAPATDTDSGVNPNGYSVCRSHDTPSGWAGCNVNLTLSATTSYTVTGSQRPAPGQRRAYYFYAHDNAGNASDPNDELYVQTLLAPIDDTLPPIQPPGTISSPDCVYWEGNTCFVNDVDFTLTVAPAVDIESGINPNGYSVCRSSDTTGWGGCEVNMILDGPITYTVSGAHRPAPGQRRAYYFFGEDRAGNQSDPSSAIYVQTIEP